MSDQPVLDEREWRLVLDLLENERRDLPSEIRHTRTAGVREELHERLAVIKCLIDRVRGQVPV